MCESSCKYACDHSCGCVALDPITPSEPCRGPYPFVGQIRRKLKGGIMYSTWDSYRRNGIQDLAPCRVRIGIPRRYCDHLPPGTPLQHCSEYNFRC